MTVSQMNWTQISGVLTQSVIRRPDCPDSVCHSLDTCHHQKLARACFSSFVTVLASLVALTMDVSPYEADAAAAAAAAANVAAMRLRDACEVVNSKHAVLLGLDARIASACSEMEDAGHFLSTLVPEGSDALAAGRVHPTTLQNLQLLPRTLISKAQEGLRAKQQRAAALPDLRMAWADAHDLYSRLASSIAGAGLDASELRHAHGSALAEAGSLLRRCRPPLERHTASGGAHATTDKAELEWLLGAEIALHVGTARDQAASLCAQLQAEIAAGRIAVDAAATLNPAAEPSSFTPTEHLPTAARRLAVLRLQSAARALRPRAQLARALDAATRIQSCWRGRYDRHVAAAMASDAVASSAAAVMVLIRAATWAAAEDAAKTRARAEAAALAIQSAVRRRWSARRVAMRRRASSRSKAAMSQGYRAPTAQTRARSAALAAHTPASPAAFVRCRAATAASGGGRLSARMAPTTKAVPQPHQRGGGSVAGAPWNRLAARGESRTRPSRQPSHEPQVSALAAHTSLRRALSQKQHELLAVRSKREELERQMTERDESAQAALAAARRRRPTHPPHRHDPQPSASLVPARHVADAPRPPLDASGMKALAWMTLEPPAPIDAPIRVAGGLDAGGTAGAVLSTAVASTATAGARRGDSEAALARRRASAQQVAVWGQR